MAEEGQRRPRSRRGRRSDQSGSSAESPRKLNQDVAFAQQERTYEEMVAEQASDVSETASQEELGKQQINQGSTEISYKVDEGQRSSGSRSARSQAASSDSVRNYHTHDTGPVYGAIENTQQKEGDFLRESIDFEDESVGSDMDQDAGEDVVRVNERTQQAGQEQMVSFGHEQTSEETAGRENQQAR